MSDFIYNEFLSILLNSRTKHNDLHYCCNLAYGTIFSYSRAKMCRIRGIKLNCFEICILFTLVAQRNTSFLVRMVNFFFFFFVVCFTAKYVSKRMTPHQIFLVNYKEKKEYESHCLLTMALFLQ